MREQIRKLSKDCQLLCGDERTGKEEYANMTEELSGLSRHSCVLPKHSHATAFRVLIISFTLFFLLF